MTHPETIATPSANADVASAICAIVAQVAKEVNIEPARDTDLFLRRIGFYGQKESRLQVIGDLHEITRERVRQIEASICDRICFDLRINKIDLSFIQSFVDGLEHSEPTSMLAANQKFKNELGAIPIEAVIAFIEMVAETPRLNVSTPAGYESALINVSGDLARLVKKAAFDIQALHGAVFIPAVHEIVAAKISVSMVAVSAIVEAIAGAKLLDENRQWFVVDAQSAIITRVQKILDVLPVVSADVAWDGVLRSRVRTIKTGLRPVKIDVPRSIFEQVIRVNSELYLSGGVISRAHPTERVFLSPSERHVVGLIESNGGAMRQSDVIKSLNEDAPCSREMVITLLSHSPVLRRVDRGVYSTIR